MFPQRVFLTKHNTLNVHRHLSSRVLVHGRGVTLDVQVALIYSTMLIAVLFVTEKRHRAKITLLRLRGAFEAKDSAYHRLMALFMGALESFRYVKTFPTTHFNSVTKRSCNVSILLEAVYVA